MVLDHIKASTGSSLHPVYRILGQDITVDLPIQTLLLYLVGAAFLGSYVLSFFKLFLDLFVRSGIDIKSFKTRNGSTWALVTGATSGIGLEFAKQLAGKGYNIVVFGRRQDALEEVASDIEKKYKVQTRFVTIDFASPSSRAEKLAELEQTIAGLDVGVLVNNVGASHEMPVGFEETSAEEMENIIQTNILGTLQLTRIVLPRLIAHADASKGSRKAKSLILNIGSLSGRIPSALLATYSCTKGGLQTWNRALAMEVKAKGVVVQMVLPAFVVSNMSKIRRPSLFVPTPAAFVRSTLSSIGLSGGAQGRAFEMTPYPTHAVADYVVGLFGGLSEWVGMKVVLDMHVGIRRRALRKKEKMAKAQ